MILFVEGVSGCDECIGWWVSVRWVTRIVKNSHSGRKVCFREDIFLLDPLCWSVGGACSRFGEGGSCQVRGRKEIAFSG